MIFTASHGTDKYATFLFVKKIKILLNIPAIKLIQYLCPIYVSNCHISLINPLLISYFISKKFLMISVQHNPHLETKENRNIDRSKMSTAI